MIHTGGFKALKTDSEIIKDLEPELLLVRDICVMLIINL